MKLAIFFIKKKKNFVLELIFCRLFLLLFYAVWAIVIKIKIDDDFKLFLVFLKGTEAQIKVVGT